MMHLTSSGRKGRQHKICTTYIWKTCLPRKKVASYIETGTDLIFSQNRIGLHNSLTLSCWQRGGELGRTCLGFLPVVPWKRLQLEGHPMLFVWRHLQRGEGRHWGPPSTPRGCHLAHGRRYPSVWEEAVLGWCWCNPQLKPVRQKEPAGSHSW